MAKIGKPRTTKGLAIFCARMAEEKIADDIVILDLTKIEVASTDYFVICTCDTDVQVRALVTSIDRKCREMNIPRPRIEGIENANWVLLDFFDVVMHVMLPDARNYYKLEKLWGDAGFYELGESGKLKALSSFDMSYSV